MSDERLPAAVEAAALIRRAEADGDFATVSSAFSTSIRAITGAASGPATRRVPMKSAISS
jgi:hypothetical protein